MLAILVASVGIANIPGLTVTHMFLFYGTFRACTMLPTMFTLAGMKLRPTGVVAGILASLCIGLPIFAYGNLTGLATYKTAGAILTVLLSGALATALSIRKGAEAHESDQNQAF